VEVMSVPGGQIAGLLGARDVRPAGDVLRNMVDQAAQILQEQATRYVLPAEESAR
jgi:hypothetical protein